MKANKPIHKNRSKNHIIIYMAAIFYIAILVREYREEGTEPAIRMLCFIVMISVGLRWAIFR